MNCPKCKREVEMLKFTTTGVMCRDCHEAERKGTPAVGSSAVLDAPTAKDAKYWEAFVLWWKPRNGKKQPSQDDPTTWDKYQYYCAGRMDERTSASNEKIEPSPVSGAGSQPKETND